jgi:putative Holliday junction resolvase
VPRILGIDYGRKRIGLAVSDSLRLIAQPLTTLLRDPAGKWWQELDGIVHEQEIEALVVGYPLSMKGTPSLQTEEVERFISELKERLSVPVYRFDERLTSAAARRALHERKIKTGHRKAQVDRIAAALILQDYLDSRK